MFITFEGIEGSGKSLQAVKTQEHFIREGKSCIVTREPGGTEFGVAVRRILLRTGDPQREPVSELLLYLADRNQHLREVVEPALDRGTIVISDRYHDATRAYQGAARGVPIEMIDALAQILGIREPDRTLLLDLEPEVGLGRARSRNLSEGADGSEGRFEAEDLSFHRNVRNAYLSLARKYPDRIRIVEASGDPEQVFSRIRIHLDEWITAHA
jgi:dTMP kinase